MPGAQFQALLSRGFGTSQTAASWTLNADNNNGVATFSFRHDITISAYGTQIRVTFVASSSAALICTHASIGITATAPSTVATPVEFLFSGAPGFSLTAGQSITSDWLSFITHVGDKLIVDIDITTANTRSLSSATGIDWYRKSAATDYATASVSGYTLTASNSNGISLVEVRQ